MALTVTAKCVIQSTTNTSTYNTTTHGSGAFAAGGTDRIMVAIVQAVEGSGTPPTPTLINHSNLSFSLITADSGSNPSSTGVILQGIWACIPSGTGSDDVDVDFGGNAQAGCNVSFFEISGFDTTPSSVDAVFNEATFTTSASGTSFTGSLSAFPDADDIYILGVGGLFIATSEDVVPEGSATQIHEAQHSSPNRTLITTYKANDTSPSVSWTTDSPYIATYARIDSTGGANATVTPSTIATTVAMPTPAVTVAAVPSVVATTVTLPEATATGGGGLSYVERLDAEPVSISGTGGSGDYTSSSFTTADDTLLVAILRYDNQNGDISAAIPTPITSGLTWVKKASVYNTGRSFTTHAEVWMADNATGGSKTIAQSGTGAWDTNTHAIDLTILEFTGAKAVADQPGATASDTDQVSSARDPGAVSITLSASPASSSYVIGVAACDCSNTNAITGGSGWTEQSEFNGNGSSHFLSSQVQTRTGSTSTTVGWDDLNSTGAGTWDYCLLAVEVEEGAASPDVTAQPDTIVTSASLSQPAATIGAVPSTVATTVALPTASVTVAATPAVVATTVTLPTPDVSVAAVLSTVVTTVTVPQPTASEATIVTPSTVVTSVAMSTAVVSVGAVPDVVATTVTLPTPVVSVAASTSTVATTTTVPTPAVAVVAAPSVIATTTTLPTSAVSVAAVLTTVVTVVTVPQPTATGEEGGAATATPDTVATTVTLPTAAVSVASLLDVVATLVSIPQVAAGVAATVSTVVTTATLPTSGVGVGGAPDVVATTVTLPASAISVGAVLSTVVTVVTVPVAVGVQAGGSGRSQQGRTTATYQQSGSAASSQQGRDTSARQEGKSA